MRKKFLYVVVIAVLCLFLQISAYANEIQLSSSQVTAKTGDTVKFILTLSPSISQGTILEVTLQVKSPSNNPISYQMNKTANGNYEFNYEVVKNIVGEINMIGLIVTAKNENGSVKSWVMSNRVELEVSK